MGNENITQLETKEAAKFSLSAIMRLFTTNSLSFYLPIALAYTWQYALVKIWNHFCLTPAANMYLFEGATFCLLTFWFATRTPTRPTKTGNNNKLGTYIAATCCCLIPFGVVLSGPFPGSDLIIGACGLSIVWFYLRCGKLYVGLNFTQTISAITGSLIIAYLIRIVMFLLPEVIAYPLLCATPLLFVLVDSRATQVKAQEVKDSARPANRLPRTNTGFLIALALELVVFNTVAGFLGTPFLVGYNWIQQIIMIGIVGVVLVFLLKHGPVIRFGQLFEIALLCCLLVFVVLSYTEDTSMLALTLMNIPHNVITAFLWPLLIDLENRREHPPLTVIAAGWGISYLSVGIGRSLSAYVITASSLPPKFVIVLVFFLVSSVLFIFNKYANYGTFSSYSQEEEREKAGIDYSEIEETCRVLGQEHGLTKREIEIVQLIAKGRSRGYIASSLVISENTVKGHTRNAYGKLGIHSKQELLTLIESR